MGGERRTESGAVGLLQGQHRQILELLDELARVEPAERRERLPAARELIGLHRLLESEVFYPATMDLRPDAVVEAALDDHDQLERQLGDLALLAPEDAGYTRQVLALRDQFRRHAELEEDSLFTKVRRHFSPEALDDLTQQMEQIVRERAGAEAESRLAPVEAGLTTPGA